MNALSEQVAFRKLAAAVLLACLCMLLGACAGGEGAVPDAAPADTRIVGANGKTDALAAKGLPTPIIAEHDGLMLHCAVKAKKLTEVLIHNSANPWALPLSTELEEADLRKALHKGTGRKAKEQPVGDRWLTGQFLHTRRAGRAGPDMSAIDCGAQAGTTVYAPVTGTVIKVTKYKLYGHADYRIHIKPEGRDELDVTLIHLTHPKVEAGDSVIAGMTSIAKVRDVFAYVGQQMELKSYTPIKDAGNHTHIQVNDATNATYRKTNGLG